LQIQSGFKIKESLPGFRSPEVEKLYVEGKAWLDGSGEPGGALNFSIDNF